MLFDGRTRRKLRDAGVNAETLRRIEREVAEEARADADRIEAFFGVGRDDDRTVTVRSDMDLTHANADYPEHEVSYVDLFTHSQDVRGWLRFDSWGAYVEGGRVLEADDADDPRVVELTLGPTVHDRVRFAHDADRLR